MSSAQKNVIALFLGTPDLTEGSVNNPVVLEENGVHYNEKWVYEHLTEDPSGMPHRVIYWHRYDFVATFVRGDSDEEWQPDSTLATDLAKRDPRLAPLDREVNPPIVPRSRYRAVSEVKGPKDLGGYIQKRTDIPPDERPD
jgi:hypothetical protein